MKVSVVIPCHNDEPYVGQAIGSLLEQSRPPHEIIVVDDVSTDGSRAVAEAFGPPVRVLSTAFGNGSDARAHGYAQTSGDAVMFFDADDVLSPRALQGLVDALRQHPGSVAACPWQRLELVNEKWVGRPANSFERRPGEDFLRAWLRGWYHPTSSVLWSRAAYDAAGGWRPGLITNQDGDLMMRALAQGVPLQLTDEGRLFYRRMPGSEASVSGVRLSEEGIRARIFILEEIAALLTRNGRLTRAYRHALDDRLKAISVDCQPPYEHLIEVCHQSRERFGRRSWERALPDFSLRAALRRLFSFRSESRTAPAPTTPPAEDEVTYGTTTAGEALATPRPQPQT